MPSPSSTPISAQGSQLDISGAAGAPRSISDVITGAPTIMKAPGHGMANGDAVTFSGFDGADASLFNGQQLVITNCTADTFAVGIDTAGRNVGSGGIATPLLWIEIGGMVSFKGFDGQAAEIDATDLKSKAKEYVTGLQDWGNFSFDLNRKFDDAGQLALDAAKQMSTRREYKLTLPNGRAKTFTAYAKNSPLEGGVDQLVKTAGVNLRITGEVVSA